MTVRVGVHTVNRKVERCGICNRPIRPDAKRLPIFGKVGDHCASKHAALTQTLEKQGLGEFLTGPIQFDPVPDDDAHGVSRWDFPAHIKQMRHRAEALGFRFEWHWPRQDGPATCQILIPRSEKLRRRLLGRLERLEVTA